MAHHRRRHHNPKSAPRRRSSGGGGRGGGTNWGMIALIGGGAFLLMKSGALGSVLGGSTSALSQQLLSNPAAAGYTDLGNGYYRNNATGQTIYRNPQTGTVQATGSAVPAGTSPWLAPFYQIGQAAIPAVAGGVASGIASLFNPSTWSNWFSDSGSGDLGTAIGSGTSAAVPDILSGGSAWALPALPDTSLSVGDWSTPSESFDWESWNPFQ